MIALRHDRINSLRGLSHYPGSEWLDRTVFLPWARETTRRVWMMAPESAPVVRINDVVLEPQRVADGPPRWIDYGAVQLPILTEPNWARGEFYQLRVRGMAVSECAAAYLVVTPRLDLALDGCSIEEAERKLWGLARADAGTTTLRPARVTAGAAGTTFTVRYSAGPQGLPAGALVRFTFPKVFGRPQVENPEAPNFLSISAVDSAPSLFRGRHSDGAPSLFRGRHSDGAVSILSIEPSIEATRYWDIVCGLAGGLARGEGFSLRCQRTERVYIFPSEWHEIDREYWYSRLPPLAAAVALSEDAPFVSLAEENRHVFEVVPGPSERVHLFLPGRRFASEALWLRGTFTDRYRNTPPGGPIDAGFELWLEGGAERLALGTPTGRFVAHHRFEIPLPMLAPGVYRAVACREGTGEVVARSNPLEIVKEGAGQDRVYWGEIHGHTEMSDGGGDYGELYRHAREEGCLEFAAATDHAEYVSDNEWQWMQDVTNGWNEPGRFVTLVGHEWEGQQRDRCVYTSRSRLELVRGNYPPKNRLDALWGLHRGDEGVVGGVHALLAHGVHESHWELYDPAVECFLEIYSMWGASDFRESPLVPDWINDWIAEGTIKPGMTANELLRKGARLGFTGGGDCHQGRCGFSSEDPDGQGITPHGSSAPILYRCGMTAAAMPGLDRESLVQAIRNRRTYATTGARILLHFTVADLPMGSIGTAREVECRATVHAVQPVRRVEIVKDGEVVWAEGPGEVDLAIRWRDPERPRGEHYYYLHVVQVDGHRAWSSPVWIGEQGQGV